MENDSLKSCGVCANDGEGFYCKDHVSCDENCGALRMPATLEQYEAALTHCESHSVDAGCSHGC